MDEPDVELTREEAMEYWQMCRVAIDYKNKRITKEQALDEFSYWSKMPREIAWLMLDPMRHENIEHLRQAFPDWIDKADEPKVRDARTATRKKNVRARKKAGLDSSDRPNKGYFDRYQTG